MIYGKNNYDLVKIICSKHGMFKQRPWAHLRGQGCPDCCNNKKLSTDEFIKKAKNKHGNLYDYSTVEYKTKKDKVKIICLNHGIFEQKAYVHTQGHGCPICKNSKLEKYLRNKLVDLGITFEQNKRYDDCRNILPLSFDFYLNTYNILIECDGIQHYKSIDYFGGDKRLEYQKLNDNIKDEYCLSKKKKLFRLNSFIDIDNLLEKLKTIY